jgi:hypothetical protein
MMKIKDFKKVGFKITWKLINIGFSENGTFKDMLDVNDILDYARNMLGEGTLDEHVLELASEYSDSIDNIKDILNELSEDESSDYELEYRKWRVMYLSQNLIFNEKNFVNGLMELNDLWIFLDYPEDSPHIFQGRNNEITPQQYYTEENYKKLYEKNLLWLNNEIKDICKQDKRYY